jgi:adenylate cyclase
MFQWQLAYAEAMTSTIRASGGTVDNFVGDDGSAWWNANEHPNHADRAVACSLGLLSAISKINQQSASFPHTRLRVGIHTGRVILGNYGSKDWLRYCPMGDAVNMAARLSRAVPYSGSPIVVSGETYDLLGEKNNLVDLGDLVKAAPERIRAYGIASGGKHAI